VAEAPDRAVGHERLALRQPGAGAWAPHVAKKGSTIPIKIQLCDVNDANVSASGIAVTANGVTHTSTATSGPVEDAGAANPDSDFRYDPAIGVTGGYIYNLATKTLTTGGYTLNFTVGANPTIYAIPFQVQ
jgi:hypothetical protein